MTLNPEKKQTKNTLLPCSKTTHIFSSISFFLYIKCLYCNCCVFWNTIKLVFSEKKHSFSKTQLVKPTFHPCPKNTFFPKKGVIFGFGQFPLKPLFHSVSWFTLFWAQKIFWPKQIVCTKMRVLSLFLTQIVSGNFCNKKNIFWFFAFLDDHLKKHYFYRVFWPFPFFLFFCFYFSNIKNAIFFDPPDFAKKKKHYSATVWHDLRFQKYPKNIIKMGENSEKLDQFLTLDLDQL